MLSLPKIEKSQRRSGHLWLASTVGSLILLVIPIIMDLQMSILHLFLLGPILFGSIAAPVYYGRAAVLRQMLDEKQHLVHWHYDSDLLPGVSNSDTIITDSGLFYVGELYTFKKYSNRLKSVTLRNHLDYNIWILDFTFIVPGTSSGQFFPSYVHVPVPVGLEKQAQKTQARINPPDKHEQRNR